MRFTSL